MDRTCTINNLVQFQWTPLTKNANSLSPQMIQPMQNETPLHHTFTSITNQKKY